MANQILEPRNTGEGSIGTTLKRWLSGFFNWLDISQYIKFTPLDTYPPHTEGFIFYDNINHVFNVYNENSEIINNLGRELLIRVYNDTGLAITNGKIVYISGSDGIRTPKIALAKADIEYTSRAVGVVNCEIADGAYGYVMGYGKICNMNTSSFLEGDTLYLSDAVAGEFTKIKPSIAVIIGRVIKSDVSEGIIYISIDTLGVVGADMLKSIYDTNDNDIVDKAENIDDGAGNASTAADVKDTVDKKHIHNNKSELDLVTDGDHDIITSGNPHSVTKSDVGLGNVDNIQQIPLSQKGSANGVAELDVDSKILISQLPDAILGAMKYQGTWDASGSYPLSPEQGDYWVTNIAGSPETGIEFEIGDWLVYNGTSWDKIDNSDKVSSVAGKTGVVTLVEADITDMHAKNADTQLDNGEVEVDSDKCFKIKETAYFDIEYNNGNSGSSININWKLGNKQRLILTDDCTVTFTNPSGVCNLILKLIQDEIGSRTITFPASVKWAGGIAPTLSTDINKIDIVTLYFDGTNYFGLASFDFI